MTREDRIRRAVSSAEERLASTARAREWERSTGEDVWALAVLTVIASSLWPDGGFCPELARHVPGVDDGEVVAGLRADDAYPVVLDAVDPDRRNARGIYYTPPEVAEMTVRLAVEALGRDPEGILDPAVGMGALPLAAWRMGLDCPVVARDTDPVALLLFAERAARMGRTVRVEQVSFLDARDPVPGVDVVVMNPPYGRSPTGRRWECEAHVSALQCAPGAAVAMIHPLFMSEGEAHDPWRRFVLSRHGAVHTVALTRIASRFGGCAGSKIFREVNAALTVTVLSPGPGPSRSVRYMAIEGVTRQDKLRHVSRVHLHDGVWREAEGGLLVGGSGVGGPAPDAFPVTVAAAKRSDPGVADADTGLVPQVMDVGDVRYTRPRREAPPACSILFEPTLVHDELGGGAYAIGCGFMGDGAKRLALPVPSPSAARWASTWCGDEDPGEAFVAYVLGFMGTPAFSRAVNRSASWGGGSLNLVLPRDPGLARDIAGHGRGVLGIHLASSTNSLPAGVSRLDRVPEHPRAIVTRTGPGTWRFGDGVITVADDEVMGVRFFGRRVVASLIRRRVARIVLRRGRLPLPPIAAEWTEGNTHAVHQALWFCEGVLAASRHLAPLVDRVMDDPSPVRLHRGPVGLLGPDGVPGAT